MSIAPHAPAPFSISASAPLIPIGEVLTAPVV
jgi:hypothetical protein